MFNYVRISIWFSIIGFILNNVISITQEEFYNDCKNYEQEKILNIICSNGSVSSTIEYIAETYKENVKVRLKFQEMYIEELSNEHLYDITGDKRYEINFRNNYIQNIEIGRDVIKHRLQHNIIFDISSPKNRSDLHIPSSEHYTIDFSNNTITNLRPGVFSYLQNNPKFIRFMKCNLTYVPKDVFSDLSFVYLIDLSHNNLSNLTKSTFVNITVDEDVEWMYEFKNSTIINLNHCDITTMEAGTFERLGLQTLNLSNNLLTTIPERLFIDCKIYSLDLSNNFISTLDAMSFADIALSLQQLYLIKNNLTVLTSNMLEKNRILENIYLQWNPIEYIEPNAFVGLKNIRNKTFDVEQRNLYLPYDLKIPELMPYTFNGLKNMVELDLSDRGIQEIYPESFHGLIRLEYLRLNNNNISTLKPATFIGLYSIFWIEIVNNIITELDSKSFAGLSHAHRFYLLNMKNNQISNIPDEIFSHTPTLKILNLESNQLSLIKNSTLTDLRNLAILNLSQNQLIYFHAPVMLSLRTLFLNNNNLLYIDIDDLIKNLVNLRKLEIDNNQWPCHILQDIVTKLNETQIDFRSSFETNTTEYNSTISEIEGIICYNTTFSFEDINQSLLNTKYANSRKSVSAPVNIEQYTHYIDGSRNQQNALIVVFSEKDNRIILCYFILVVEVFIFFGICVLPRIKGRFINNPEEKNNMII